MAILDYLEWALATLFYNKRGHDDQLFTKGPASACKDIPENITITSPDNGPSGSTLKRDCIQLGADSVPELTWDKPTFDVKEYLVVVQDVDAPLPFISNHGIIWGVPGQTTHIKASDIELMDKIAGISKGIRSGWNIGKNVRGTHYVGAKPLLEHGPHRYFYQVVALKEPINPEGLSKTAATLTEL